MSHPYINYATNSHNNTHYSRDTNSFDNDIVLNVNNIGAADERSEVLAWLSPLEPRVRHQDIRTLRADNVGEWLLETAEFRVWCDGAQKSGSEPAILFCCGDPAVGKTYFSSLVVDRLCDKAKVQNVAVACFYVDFAAQESLENILNSLLKQIIGGLERIPDEITQTFRDHKKVIGGKGLRVPEIVKMLQVVTSSQPTFICVDALDQCVEGCRPKVLDSLRRILEKSPNARIFLTARRHIHGEIERHLGGRAATLVLKPSNDDIVEYVRMRLSKDIYLDAMDGVLEAEIIKRIAENIPETFLLISLTMDAILGETTAYGRRGKLRTMAGGLGLNGVYGATLKRIKEQGGEKSRLGMAALMWISHSERLLQLDELSHALAVEVGSTDFNPERIPSVETLLSSCLGLVVVDREASTLRLIHFTLQEYLYTCPDLFGSAHSIMAEACLTYLNFRTIKEIPPTVFAPPLSTAFLNYSSKYWGAHARRHASREVISLALKLFSQIESHISTKLLLADLISRTSRSSYDIPISGHLVGFTGLHCASVFGIAEIATTLVGQPNSDFNKTDFLGITPLIWAAICGRDEIAKLLLEQQTVIPDKPDKFFHRTPLSWAAGKGHEGMVRLFLDLGYATPTGAGGWWGKTSRLLNRVLGRRYVNPNRPDKYGQTAISLAAEEGHEGAVKLLLGRGDVNPDATDGYGHTPIFWAFSKGHEGVIKLLLEREDVRTDIPDENGQALLLLAAESGYEGVVRLLLGRKDVNPNVRGKAGQTSLLLASRKGHDGVVKLLLGRGDVNPSMIDDRGQTPLLQAASTGCDGVVQLLLERGDVNPDIPNNNDGRTPLSRAAENGHDGVVKLLLGRKDVSPDMPDDDDRTPLLWAAENGRDGVVKLLLGREDVSPERLDNSGRTPLLLASLWGHEGVVKLLLQRKDTNPNTPNKAGRTPLLFAARYGREGVVKLLLEREDVNPNVLDKYGKTPLWWASENQHEGVSKLLQARESTNPSMA